MSSRQPRIRAARFDDRPAILDLVRAAFDNDGVEEVEIVEKVWASGRTVLDLVAADADADAGDDGGGTDGDESADSADTAGIVGHALFSLGDIDGRSVPALAPLAVTPDRQRQGVGGALLRHAIERLDAEGHPCIVLLGHPSYYPRFGFEPGVPLGIEPVNAAAFRDLTPFMVLRLAAFDESLAGVFRYAWELPPPQ